MPSPLRAWTTVAIVFLAYLASFVDRTILSLLVEPIRADLALSDVQIGLVGGLAFGVLYALLGLPLGWLADRRSRRAIIAAGIVVWSLATAACGLSRSFEHLFAARIMVGVGEAALAPAALSLIAASFPAERRALPVAVFVMAGSVGGGAAMILGGRVVAAIAALGPVAWPLVGHLAPWQASFVAVGLAGLPIAALAAAITEPPRIAAVATGPSGGDRERPAWRTLLPLFSAMTMLSIVAYGYLAWIPTHFIRRFGWTAPEVGLWFGTIFLIGGAAGALAGGVLSTRGASGRPAGGATLRVVAIGLTLLAVPAVAAPLATTALGALLWLAPVMVLFALPSGAAVAAVQSLTPADQRGRVAALYYLTLNLFGLSSGAALVAILGGWFGSLGAGMAAIAAVAIPLAAACAWLAFRSLRAAR